VVFWVVTS